MSEKFDQFINELDQLCKKHDVTVTSSMYDQPAVWDGYDGDDVAMILDKTGITDEVGEVSITRRLTQTKWGMD